MKPSIQAELLSDAYPAAASLDASSLAAQRVDRSSQPIGDNTARNTQTTPPRRFDPHALAAGEQLLLTLLYSLCGALAVVAVYALSVFMKLDAWLHWRLWAVLLPAAVVLSRVKSRSRLGGHPQLVESLTFIALAIQSVLIVTLLQALLWLCDLGGAPARVLIGLIAAHLVLCWTARLVLLKLIANWRRKLRVVILGVGDQGLAVAKHLQDHPEDIEIVGFVDERRTRVDPSTMSMPFLGTLTDMYSLGYAPDLVILAMPSTAATRIQTLTTIIRCRGIDVYLAPEAGFLGRSTTRHTRQALESSLLLNLNALSLDGRIVKRLFDIVVSATALAIFLPFGLIIAALIKLESPGPVIFRQPRFGRGNYLFSLYKFRSMRIDRGGTSAEIRLTERGDSRVTKIGAFLRSTSLDEFPQFLNVLLGHMSVVGPRPHPPGVKAGERIYEEVVPDFMERYALRPGITGWAQVNGLRGNTFTESHLVNRFAFDIEYIRNWSLELDVWIVLRTMKVGFGGKNAF